MTTGNHYDVITIGTGAGGGTLASKLAPSGPPATGPFPHPAVSHEGRIQELHDDLVKLGHRPFNVPLGIMLNERNRAKSACIRCNTCDGFPCLVNAKSDAQVCGIEPALE